ncbi:MAG TPA: hypothetical protein ACQGQJ_04610 [Xylella fastidiosa subsp. multiplex]
MGELIGLKADLAQIVRLALVEQAEDVHLFAARLVRKYRGTEPESAEQVDLFLRAKPHRRGTPLRKMNSPLLPDAGPLRPLKPRGARAAPLQAA